MIVELSKRAEAELASAVAFLRRESPGAADKLHAAIERGLDSLSEFPRRGRVGQIGDTREPVVRGAPYIIVYAIHGDVVFVARIRHTSQDPSPE